MLSVSAMSGGQGAYYTGLAREDYYLDGGEPPGLWTGKGALMLRLRGEVDRQVFASLFDGFDAGGVPLVQNAGKPKRQPGWDLTFSAPKSVSVLWSLLPAEMGAKVREAHLAAVREACQYLEDTAGVTRRGRAGITREKTGLVIGLFEHGTSRAGDPQLHTHALVLNIGVRADGTTGSILSQSFYEHKMAAGALYRAELARQLEARLQLSVHRVKSWFEVDGVSQKLMESWSTRRAEIEAALEKSGHTSARASEVAALTTRQVKSHFARHELFSEWQAYGEKSGWGVKEAIAVCNRFLRSPDPPGIARAMAVNDALEQITAHNACFEEKELVRRVAEQAQGRGIGAQEALEAARSYLKDQAVFVGKVISRDKKEVPVYTTREMLGIEQAMLARVEESRSSYSHLVPIGIRAIQKFRHRHLRDEQMEAVDHVTSWKGGITVVTGMAGTGKTTMLKAAADMWKMAGFKVKGAALAGKAADGLATGADIESSTIAKILFQLDKGREVFTRDTVLVVDEAGMVGTRQMARLVEETQKAGAKLVLVGDARQLQPVEAGGPFAAIASKVGEVTMKEIIRQKEGWARQAVHDLADGNAGNALNAYAERGLLSVSDDKAKAREALIADWRAEGVREPEKNLIIAGTNQDAAALNRQAQLLRWQEGALAKECVKVGGSKLHTGDRVMFTKNSSSYGVFNGQIGTIRGVSDDNTDTIHVTLDSGQNVSVPTVVYKNVQLGYAVTTHKSQGVTTTNAFILTDASMQDRELSYVQASRVTDTARFYTTEEEMNRQGAARGSLLTARMSHSRQKELATDIMEERRIKEALRLSQEQQQRDHDPTLRQEIRLTM